MTNTSNSINCKQGTSIVATVGLVTSLVLTSPVGATSDLSCNQPLLASKGACNQVRNYLSSNQSTFGQPPLQNNTEMNQILEIASLVDVIERRYNTQVVDTWMPASGLLSQVCLFVSLSNQDDLVKNCDNLELELLLLLEDKLKESHLFDMIALM